MRAFQPGLASTGVATNAGSLALTVIYTDAGWRVVTVDHRSAMTTAPSRRWAGLLLGLAGVLLTGCTMAGARGATISTIARASNGWGLPTRRRHRHRPRPRPGAGSQRQDRRRGRPRPRPRPDRRGHRGRRRAGRIQPVQLRQRRHQHPRRIRRRPATQRRRTGRRPPIAELPARQGRQQPRLHRPVPATPDDRLGHPGPADQPGHRHRQVPRPDGQSRQLANRLTLDRRPEGAGLPVQRRRDLPRQLPAGHRHRRRAQHRTGRHHHRCRGRASSPRPRPQPARPAVSRPPNARRRRVRRPGAATRTDASPRSALCPVPSAPALQLECGAATAFDQLNTAFKAAFGQNIGITDGYRSYDEQVQCRLEKGSLCANPGTSNHGWGKAVDIGGCCGINTGAGPAFDWLTANAGRYGWNHPAWAQAGGSKPEPWHWEYGAIS